jgi:NIMA-interacting peptidyl-prolyl cis-trans isomerase 1
VRFSTLAALAVLVACDKTGATGTGAEAASASVTPSATAAASATTTASAGAATTASASAAPSARAPVPDTIAAQHVLVAYKGAKDAPKGVTRSKADAKKRAEEVVTKAKGGADFTALVTEYSDDPGAKDRMGSLGKFTRDKMVKPFSDAAFALQVGEVSDAVETPYGYHVIKRNQ